MESITRRQLYDRIWRDNMRTTALSLKLRPQDLTAICHKFDIPTPSSTYWIHKALGKPTQQTPLPAAGREVSIDLRPWFRGPSVKTGKSAGYEGALDAALNDTDAELRRKKLLAKARKGEFIIDIDADRQSRAENINAAVSLFPVQEALKTRRDVILQAKAYFRLANMPYDRRVNHPDYGRYSCRLGISTSRELEQRALSLFDSLISILETLGGQMQYGDYECAVRIAQVSVGISIAERNRRVANEQRTSPYDSQFVYKPSGQLKVTVSCNREARTVADTDFVKVENKLDAVVTRIFDVVDAELEWREKIRQRELEERRRAEERQKEQERLRQLESLKEGELAELRRQLSQLRRCLIASHAEAMMQRLGDSERERELAGNLARLRDIMNPAAAIPADVNLTEADLDALADEFFGKERTPAKTEVPSWRRY